MVISTSVSQWLSSGRLGELGVGSGSDKVLRVLGAPPFAGPRGGCPIPGYWLYGEIEFGIGDDARVSWIQADTVNLARDDRSRLLSVDWQGLTDRQGLAAVMKWLDAHALAYNVLDDEDGGATVQLDGCAQLLLTQGAIEPELCTILISGHVAR